MKFPQLLASPEDFMNPDMAAGGFPAFWDLYSRYSAAMVVISVMIDVEREQVEKYRFKNERASANDANSPK